MHSPPFRRLAIPIRRHRPMTLGSGIPDPLPSISDCVQARSPHQRPESYADRAKLDPLQTASQVLYSARTGVIEYLRTTESLSSSKRSTRSAPDPSMATTRVDQIAQTSILVPAHLHFREPEIKAYYLNDLAHNDAVSPNGSNAQALLISALL